jgi:hypothetical protein
MKTIAIATLLVLAAASVGWAGEPEGIFDQYFLRSDSITPDAGNAKDANEAIQIIDPWSRRAADRRIPADGGRMTGAIQRYRSNQQGRADQQSGGQFTTTITPGSGSTSGTQAPTSASQ